MLVARMYAKVITTPTKQHQLKGLQVPNWVSNWVGISGKTTDLQAFVEKAKQQYTTNYPKSEWVWDAEQGKNVQIPESERGQQVEALSGESPMSFWNFIEPENKVAYFADAHGKKPEGFADWTPAKQLEYNLKCEGDGWYDWNIANWGTKWDASDAGIDTDYLKPEEENSSISYTFQTAWSVPEPVFQAMVKQHPELSFDFECEEEQGWGVKFTSSDLDDDGERSLIEVESWDIPDSHADYVARDREDSCSCVWADDEDDWFDDCPRPEKDFYVVVTKTYKVRTNTAENAWELAQDNDPEEQMELQEDETFIEVRDVNGERLFPTLTDGEPKVKTCNHHFAPVYVADDENSKSEYSGYQSCVFCAISVETGEHEPVSV